MTDHLKRSTLVLIGTGIHVGHLTEESREWLQLAEKVLYCVADAATERLILKLNASAESMYPYYGEGKRRIETYNQMIDRTLECVRTHETVVVAYYGHPGFFVYPSHRAIELARQEGHQAFMLPAVSSFDCLIADLGINAAEGCQIFEATELMVRQRIIDPASHVIILQVSSVGDPAYSFKGFDRRNVPSLGEYLQQIYPSDFEVKAYYAAQFPIAKSTIETIKISDLVDKDAKRISTLYVPPRDRAPIHLRMLRQYGLDKSFLEGRRLIPLNISLQQAASGHGLSHHMRDQDRE